MSSNRSSSRSESRSLPSQAVNLLCKTEQHPTVAVRPGLKLITTFALSHPCNNYLHRLALYKVHMQLPLRLQQLVTCSCKQMLPGEGVAYFPATATKANITRHIYHGRHVGHLINTWQQKQPKQSRINVHLKAGYKHFTYSVKQMLTGMRSCMYML